MKSGDAEAKRVREAMEPPWDEVREQRVLARVLEATRASSSGVGTTEGGKPVIAAKAASRNAARLRWLPIAAAVVLAATAVVGVVALRRQRSVDGRAANVASSAAIAENQPEMKFADGSQATLLHGAKVQIEVQREDETRLTQSSGEVRYEVKHDPLRRFIVRAGRVEVRVRGTGFTISYGDGKSIEVQVAHGAVEVDDGARVHSLSTGQALRIPTAASTIGGDPAGFDVPSVAPSSTTSALAAGALSTAKKAEPAATVEALLAQADAARAAGRLSEAAEALERMIALHPGDGRVASALFTLGRVQRKRGLSSAAAQAFARCWKLAPAGSLAEDARAEEALAWSAAGDTERARTAAKRYLALHPTGTSASRMRTLSE